MQQSLMVVADMACYVSLGVLADTMLVGSLIDAGIEFVRRWIERGSRMIESREGRGRNTVQDGTYLKR